MTSTIGLIAAGGALGAVARHFANNGIGAVLPAGFPWGIMLVNIIGCFIMGMLVALFASSWNTSQDVRAFLTVGFLGGFTTFSAFSLDTMNLWTKGDMTGALVYVLGSVVLSILAVFAGSWLIWKFAA
jgi:fluoride exporter